MSVVDFRRFAPPERLRCFAPRNLMQLLAPHAAWLQSCGFPIPSEESPPDHAALSELLSRSALDTPSELLDALFLIDEVCDGPNLELLLEDAACSGFALPLDEDATAADLALLVYCHRPEILYRRHSMLVAERLRTYESFRTCLFPAIPFVRPGEETLLEMAAAVDGWFGRRRRDVGTRIVCAESGHWLCLLICHGDVPGQTGGRGRGPCRSGGHDTVAYHCGTGELRVSGRTKEARAFYRRAFGRLLSGNEGHFPAVHSVYTLEPLRRDGKASLACLDVEGLDRITLKRLALDWGGLHGEIEMREAKDLFGLLEKRGGSIPSEPALRSATFEIVFSGSRCPRRVTVTPPNMVHLLRDGDGPLVEEWLQRREFVRREGAGDGVARGEDVLADT